MKDYEGSTYIGVVGPETDYGVSWRSIVGLAKRTGDSDPNFYSGTKGYELRQLHVDKFMASHHAFLLMLDHDMVFASDTLERLRSHKKPYVSGLYMRRMFNPIAPIWFENNPRGLWPAEPMTRDPERGRLHPLGGSGWGCLLLHREVIEATRVILKGEPEIIEDAMSVWPYDLGVVLDAVRGLRALVEEKPTRSTLLPALEAHTATLEAEIRPLRGEKRDPIGSDIRFPFYARAAGFLLLGDPDVRPAHMVNYQLTPNDFTQSGADFQEALYKDSTKRVGVARSAWRKAIKAYQ